jgi:hypothetical protein
LSRTRGTTLAKAVQAGVALLDDDRPDWRERISRAIEVNSVYDCPIAQTYGDFSDAGRDLYQRVTGAEPYRYPNETSGPTQDFWRWCYDHGFAVDTQEQPRAAALWEKAARVAVTA